MSEKNKDSVVIEAKSAEKKIVLPPELTKKLGSIIVKESFTLRESKDFMGS
jgi:hypothetical protein